MQKKLFELGERKIIEIFAEEFKKNKCRKLVLGIGDDAAVLKLNKEVFLVASCDAVYQKTHIAKEMTPEQIGKYAVNTTLSDIAAMGAFPLGLLFSFGLPRNLGEDFVKKIALAIRKECEKYNICVLGGDTKESSEITIIGSALGIAKNGRWLEKKGAKIGDAICVTGAIGSAAAGFYCLIKSGSVKIPEKIKKQFIKTAFEPKAKIKEGLILSKYASACTDISDGLAFSLHEIATAGNVGFKLYESKLPVSKYVKIISSQLNLPINELTLHKGGDYELLFTAKKENVEKIRKETQKIGAEIYEIGVIAKKGCKIVGGGKEKELEAKGYEAFRDYIG